MSLVKFYKGDHVAAFEDDSIGAIRALDNGYSTTPPEPVPAPVPAPAPAPAPIPVPAPAKPIANAKPTGPV